VSQKKVCSICGHRIPVGLDKTSIQVSAFPSAVLPEFLYLGSYDNASRLELLKTQGISRILNTVPSCQNLYKNSFTYHCLPDDKTLPFDEAIQFLVLGLLQRLEHPVKADGSLSLMVIGDWGRKGTYNQSQVATQMGRVAAKLNIDFVISTGDNFYDDGLTGIDDPAFEISFSKIYTAKSLQKKWYSVLGNHDYRGDVEAQLNPILQKIDPRWICQRSFIVDTGKFFFIDSTPFVDQYFFKPKDHKYDWRGVLPREKYLSKLLKDLEIALKDSTAKWKIVVGHHPIRSIGHHGDTKELIRQLLPILEMLIMNLMLCDVLIQDSKIEQCEKDKERVLVHCMSGKSRSLAIVIAYLMKSKVWRLVHSYQWVKERRPSVELTQGVYQQLQEFEEKIYGRIDSGSSLVPGFLPAAPPSISFGFPKINDPAQLPSFSAGTPSIFARAPLDIAPTEFTFGAGQTQKNVAGNPFLLS
ncbi:Purple acid phosphatase 3, partial [Glycine soja]